MHINYEELSDEELIAKSHGGEDSATDFLLEKYKPLVRKKARALFLIGGETEDLIQEGMIALYKATRDFTPGENTSFFTYASTCIEHQLYNVIKGANRLKNSPLNTYVSLYTPTATSDDISSRETLADTLQPSELINPEDIFIDKENVSILEQAIQQHLSTFEQTVVHLYIDGHNYQHIAKILDKSGKSVDNALQRAKKKLETAIKNKQ